LTVPRRPRTIQEGQLGGCDSTPQMSASEATDGAHSADAGDRSSLSMGHVPHAHSSELARRARARELLEQSRMADVASRRRHLASSDARLAKAEENRRQHLQEMQARAKLHLCERSSRLALLGAERRRKRTEARTRSVAELRESERRRSEGLAQKLSSVHAHLEHVAATAAAVKAAKTLQRAVRGHLQRRAAAAAVLPRTPKTPGQPWQPVHVGELRHRLARSAAPAFSDETGTDGPGDTTTKPTLQLPRRGRGGAASHSETVPAAGGTGGPAGGAAGADRGQGMISSPRKHGPSSFGTPSTAQVTPAKPPTRAAAPALKRVHAHAPPEAALWRLMRRLLADTGFVGDIQALAWTLAGQPPAAGESDGDGGPGGGVVRGMKHASPLLSAAAVAHARVPTLHSSEKPFESFEDVTACLQRPDVTGWARSSLSKLLAVAEHMDRSGLYAPLLQHYSAGPEGDPAVASAAQVSASSAAGKNAPPHEQGPAAAATSAHNPCLRPSLGRSHRSFLASLLFSYFPEEVLATEAPGTDHAHHAIAAVSAAAPAAGGADSSRTEARDERDSSAAAKAQGASGAGAAAAGHPISVAALGTGAALQRKAANDAALVTAARRMLAAMQGLQQQIAAATAPTPSVRSRAEGKEGDDETKEGAGGEMKEDGDRKEGEAPSTAAEPASAPLPEPLKPYWPDQSLAASLYVSPELLSAWQRLQEVQPGAPPPGGSHGTAPLRSALAIAPAPTAPGPTASAAPGEAAAASDGSGTHATVPGAGAGRPRTASAAEASGAPVTVEAAAHVLHALMHLYRAWCAYMDCFLVWKVGDGARVAQSLAPAYRTLWTRFYRYGQEARSMIGVQDAGLLELRTATQVQVEAMQQQLVSLLGSSGAASWIREQQASVQAALRSASGSNSPGLTPLLRGMRPRGYSTASAGDETGGSDARGSPLPTAALGRASAGWGGASTLTAASYRSSPAPGSPDLGNAAAAGAGGYQPFAYLGAPGTPPTAGSASDHDLDGDVSSERIRVSRLARAAQREARSAGLRQHIARLRASSSPLVQGLPGAEAAGAGAHGLTTATVSRDGLASTEASPGFRHAETGSGTGTFTEALIRDAFHLDGRSGSLVAGSGADASLAGEDSKETSGAGAINAPRGVADAGMAGEAKSGEAKSGESGAERPTNAALPMWHRIHDADAGVEEIWKAHEAAVATAPAAPTGVAATRPGFISPELPLACHLQPSPTLSQLMRPRTPAGVTAGAGVGAAAPTAAAARRSTSPPVPALQHKLAMLAPRDEPPLPASSTFAPIDAPLPGFAGAGVSRSTASVPSPVRATGVERPTPPRRVSTGSGFAKGFLLSKSAAAAPSASAPSGRGGLEGSRAVGARGASPADAAASTQQRTPPSGSTGTRGLSKGAASITPPRLPAPNSPAPSASASGGLSNEAMAHELLLNPEFRLPSPEIPDDVALPADQEALKRLCRACAPSVTGPSILAAPLIPFRGKTKVHRDTAAAALQRTPAFWAAVLSGALSHRQSLEVLQSPGPRATGDTPATAAVPPEFADAVVSVLRGVLDALSDACAAMDMRGGIASAGAGRGSPGRVDTVGAGSEDRSAASIAGSSGASAGGASALAARLRRSVDLEMHHALIATGRMRAADWHALLHHVVGLVRSVEAPARNVETDAWLAGADALVEHVHLKHTGGAAGTAAQHLGGSGGIAPAVGDVDGSVSTELPPALLESVVLTLMPRLAAWAMHKVEELRVDAANAHLAMLVPVLATGHRGLEYERAAFQAQVASGRASVTTVQEWLLSTLRPVVSPATTATAVATPVLALTPRSRRVPLQRLLTTHGRTVMTGVVVAAALRLLENRTPLDRLALGGGAASPIDAEPGANVSTSLDVFPHTLRLDARRLTALQDTLQRVVLVPTLSTILQQIIAGAPAASGHAAGPTHAEWVASHGGAAERPPPRAASPVAPCATIGEFQERLHAWLSDRTLRLPELLQGVLDAAAGLLTAAGKLSFSPHAATPAPTASGDSGVRQHADMAVAAVPAAGSAESGSAEAAAALAQQVRDGVAKALSTTHPVFALMRGRCAAVLRARVLQRLLDDAELDRLWTAELRTAASAAAAATAPEHGSAAAGHAAEPGSIAGAHGATGSGQAAAGESVHPPSSTKLKWLHTLLAREAELPPHVRGAILPVCEEDAGAIVDGLARVLKLSITVHDRVYMQALQDAAVAL